jgi:lycopene beta-cyclase
MKTDPYDIIILGAGCFGTSLARELQNKNFRGSVLLLDQRKHFNTTQRWCYWAPKDDRSFPGETARWDNFSCRTAPGAFQTKALTDWSYRHVEAPIFFAEQHKQLAADPSFHFHFGEPVLSVSRTDNTLYEVTTGSAEFSARRVIDARATPGRRPNHNYAQGEGWWQSFLGWEFKTEESPIATDTFLLMDFEGHPDDPLGFGYVLPLPGGRVLVEYTVFDPVAVPLLELEDRLSDYSRRLDLNPADRLAQEHGWLPMSMEDPEPEPEIQGVWRGGIRGGCARPSSGYAFARIQKLATGMADSLVAEAPMPPRADSTSSRMMDQVFLRATLEDSHFARLAFKSLLDRTKGDHFAAFMAEDFRVGNFANIVAALPKWPFMLAFSRVFLGRGLRGRDTAAKAEVSARIVENRRWFHYPLILAIAFTLGGVAIGQGGQAALAPWILLLSIFFLGFPHGAADIRLAPYLGKRRHHWGLFLGGYLALSGLVFLAWWVSPLFTAIGFLILTAWHWGSAEAVPLRRSQGPPAERSPWTPPAVVHSFLRGGWIMLGPLALHPTLVENLFATWGVSLSLASSSHLWLSLWSVFWLGEMLAVVASARLKDRRVRRALLLEISLLGLVQVLLHPLWWIALYFMGFHAWRHTLRMASHFYPLEYADSRFWGQTLRKTLGGLTWTCVAGGVAILLIFVYLRHGTFSISPVAWIGDYFAVIAAFTLPHALLVAWLDQRENEQPQGGQKKRPPRRNEGASVKELTVPLAD